MRFVLAVLAGVSATGCGKKCLEYDPGQGCDLVFICCTRDDKDCEYVTRNDEVYECAGGALNCNAAARDMLCDVCGGPVYDGLNCRDKGGGGGGKDTITCNDGTKSTCSQCYPSSCCLDHGGCEP